MYKDLKELYRILYDSEPTVKDLQEMLLLTEIEIRNKELKEIPYGIRSCKNLEWLELQNNKITTIPDWLFDLSKLRVLTLFNNKITTIPDSFCYMTNIQAIQLQDNYLRKLPENFSNLKTLFSLNLSNNFFTEIPNIKGCFLIQHLHMNYNPLEIFDYKNLPENCVLVHNNKVEWKEDILIKPNQITTM